jgi:hypothetical protein
LAGKAALILTGFTGKITLALSATSPTEWTKLLKLNLSGP